MSYHALLVCGLCSNLATTEVSCPMKYGRVLQLSTRRSLSRTLSTIAIIARRTSLFFSVQWYCSFSLHLPGHRPAD